MKTQKRKLNLSIDENVADRIEIYAKKFGLSKSSFVTVACKEYIDAQDKIPDLREQIENMLKKLEDLENK